MKRMQDLSNGLRDRGFGAQCILGLMLCLATGQAQAASFECLIEPWQVVEVRSPVEGLIEKVAVQRGDAVYKGQLLVQLQSAAERSAVDSARYRSEMEGRASSARHRLEFADKKLKRAIELSEEKFVAIQAKDEAEAEWRLAESDLKDAVENLELAKIEHRRAKDLLDLRTLKSPFNGVVVERMLNVGDIAEAGTGRKPILKIAQIDPLRVEVLLPMESFRKVQIGTQVGVTAEGISGNHSATVRVVDRVADAASGTIGVRLELPNPGGKLPAGLRCQVEFAQIKSADLTARRQRVP